MGLTVVTAATGSVVSLETAKAHLRVDLDQHDQDAYILTLIEAAVDEIGRLTNRQLRTATYDLKLDAFPDWIELPKPPLASVTSITYIDTAGVTQTLASTKYQVDTTRSRGRILPAVSDVWPSTQADRINAVTVRFVAGYGTLPQSMPPAVHLATLLLIEAHYSPAATEARQAALVLLGPLRSRAERDQ